MNPDLLRQRRNLILISCVLIVFDFAKVSIAKISVLGTELLIGDAKVLMVFVWVFWVYAFLRYYQYLRAEGDLKIIAAYRVGVQAQVRSYVMNAIKKVAISGEIKYSRSGIRWEYFVREYDPVRGGDKETFRGFLPAHKLLWWMVRSGFYIAINTPKATDHVLPVLLGVSVPLVHLVK